MPTESKPDQLANELQADLKTSELITPDERTTDDTETRMMQEESNGRGQPIIHAGASASGKRVKMHNGNAYRHDGHKSITINNYHLNGCVIHTSGEPGKSRRKLNPQSVKRVLKKLALLQKGNRKQVKKEPIASFEQAAASPS